MSQDRVGKPWTKEEDELLTQAVAVHGEVDNWKTIALSVPGRTNKACRKVGSMNQCTRTVMFEPNCSIASGGYIRSPLQSRKLLGSLKRINCF